MLKQDYGFVLPVVLLIGMMFAVAAVGIQYSSITSFKVVEASYEQELGLRYAEAGLEWFRWAWANDAEFAKGNSGCENKFHGDRNEWYDCVDKPTKAIPYLDNRPISQRPIVWPTRGINVQAMLSKLSNKIIVYNGEHIPGISPSLKFGSKPPYNGAAIWLEPEDSIMDKEIEIDESGAACGRPKPADRMACDKITGQWVSYHLVVYSLGIVDGHVRTPIREDL